MHKLFQLSTYGYFGATLLSIIFGFVYLSFVPGVFEPFLVFLGLIPGLMGLFPSLVMDLVFFLHRGKKNMVWMNQFYHSGVAILTVYGALEGIYRIALATSPYQIYFLITAISFILLGMILQLLKKFFRVNKIPSR